MALLSIGAGMKRAGPLASSVARVGRAHLSFTRSPSKTLPRTTTAVTTVTRTTRRQCSGERLKSEPPPPPPSRGAGAPPLEPKPKPSLFMAYLGRYTALLETRPLATKAITSGVIAFAGDITWQLIAIEFAARGEPAEEDEGELGATSSGLGKAALVASDIDWGRCARFTFLGTTFVAPALHYWYGFLIRRFPGTALSTVVKRVALDQLVFAPIFLGSFLSAVMVLDGNAAKIGPKLRADYTATVASNWGYWIPAQVINFRFVAPAYQVLYANGVGFFWNIYLSYQSNKKVAKKAPPGTTSSPRAPLETHNA